MTSVTVTRGLGVEEGSVSLGLDSTDSAGTIVGRLTGLPGETEVVLTFSEHFVKRPRTVIVTNAFRDLQDFGNYSVRGWDHSSFTITQDFKLLDNVPSQIIPLYYYAVL